MLNFKSNDLRISFIWVTTILDFLKGTVAPGAPMAFLGDEVQYKHTFDQLLQSLPQGVIQPPWFKPKEDFFWFYYVENTQPMNMTGTKAWKFLVPLRMKIPFKVIAPSPTDRAYLEGFFYPHGLAVVLTAECTEPLTLDETRDLAFDIRQNKFLKLTIPGQAQPQDLHLNLIADRAMTFLTQVALGPQAKAPQLSPAFSIWTVVRGDGVNPLLPTPNGGDVHKVLEAVTTFNPNFATANLPNIAANSAQLRKKRSAGDVLYCNNRGRAVWFPGTFTLPPGPKRSMACYHRNLIYASMQVESLCRLTRETAKEMNQPGATAQLPIQQYNYVKRAAGILTRMYSALEDKTYRSGSPYMQIRQNNFIGDINKVRQEMLMVGPPLV